MQAQDTWTPELVRDRLIDALQWAQRYGGATGPAPIRSAMPKYAATLEDHLEEGWGLPERAGDEPISDAKLRVAIGAEAVARHMAALEWQVKYLAKVPHSRAALALWLRCKVNRLPFGPMASSAGLSRSAAYSMRDAALVQIARGLDKDGVSL